MKQISGNAYNIGEDITAEKLCAMFTRRGPGAKTADAQDSSLPKNAVVIAGEHFGAGERAAAAATLLRERGVVGVVAKTFGRHFYREAINSGVALFTADLTGRVANGDEVALDLRKGAVSSGDTHVQAERYPERLARVVEYGGLVTAVKKELGKE